MKNTALLSATRPLAKSVFSPPSTFQVVSSPYASLPAGEAGLNPPALKPFADRCVNVVLGPEAVGDRKLRRHVREAVLGDDDGRRRDCRDRKTS